MSSNWKTHSKGTLNASPACNIKYRGKKYSKIIFSLFISIIFFNFSTGQNIINKKWESKLVDKLILKAPYSNSISLINGDNNFIEIFMNLSGEYSSHFILSSKIEEKNLYIQEILSPAISLPNDKLSVHKVHSSNIKVKIPKFVEIFFEIENAELDLIGTYKFISILQKKGKIFLKTKSNFTKITTDKADLYLIKKIAKDSSNINFETKTGKIFYDY